MQYFLIILNIKKKTNNEKNINRPDVTISHCKIIKYELYYMFVFFALILVHISYTSSYIIR